MSWSANIAVADRNYPVSGVLLASVSTGSEKLALEPAAQPLIDAESDDPELADKTPEQEPDERADDRPDDAQERGAAFRLGRRADDRKDAGDHDHDQPDDIDHPNDPDGVDMIQVEQVFHRHRFPLICLLSAPLSGDALFSIPRRQLAGRAPPFSDAPASKSSDQKGGECRAICCSAS